MIRLVVPPSARIAWIALLCAAPALAEHAGRAISSVDGMYAIRFVEVGPGKCRIEALKGQEVAWSLEQCLGTIDDIYLISQDGERFWQIRALPETPNRRKGEKVSPHFRAVVAVLYDKTGKALRTKRLEDFLQRYRLGLVRQLGHHFKWLEGVMGIPGKGPRITDDNQVEFETVAQKSHRLKFE